MTKAARLGGFSVFIVFLFSLDFFVQTVNIINKGAAAGSQPRMSIQKEMTVRGCGAVISFCLSGKPESKCLRSKYQSGSDRNMSP